MSSNEQPQQPGLVASHAQYVKGAAVEALGSATGSQEWQQSGEHQKTVAADNMKAASEARDPAKSGFGAAEEMAGRAVGCEGMEQEGAASKEK